MSEGRHASRSSRKPALIVGGIAAVLVVGVVLVILLGGGDGAGGIIPGIGDDEGPQTPEFAFETAKILAVPTRVDVTPAEVKPNAEPVAAEIEDLMDTLYLEAFFDVDNWQAGTYDEVWPLFDASAGTEAQAESEVLTAGAGAGEAFERIDPGFAELKTKVLLDDQDQPISAVAVVIFRATGRGKDGGSDVVMRSNGQFTFRQIDGEWRIVAFHVLRNDEEQVAGPSATASPAAEAT